MEARKHYFFLSVDKFDWCIINFLPTLTLNGHFNTGNYTLYASFLNVVAMLEELDIRFTAYKLDSAEQSNLCMQRVIGGMLNDSAYLTPALICLTHLTHDDLRNRLFDNRN